MDNFMEAYFGPLGKEYCTYFYALSIFFGVGFVFSTISVLSYIVMNRKKVDGMFIANSFVLLLNSFLLYFVNRLLNTMCVKSL
jgi:hypothetical protein